MGGWRRGFLAAAAAGTAVVTAVADHAPLGAVDPTDQEQLGIYTLNRARNDPAAYGMAIGFDLGGVAARPPLAVNRNLVGSSRFHASEMFGHHYFAHTSAVTGDGPNAMAVQAGYDAFGSGLGFDWGSTNTIESNARGVNQLGSLTAALAALIIDKDVPGAGHRVHLMATVPQFQAHREVGMGIATGTDSFPEFGLPKLLPTRLYSIHTANRGGGQQFVTGVVFRDRNGNLRYDAGEGIGGASVLAGGQEVQSLPSGGYSIPVGTGGTTVTCSHDGWTGRVPVVVGSDNVEVDFHVGRVGGEAAFGFRNGLPAPLTTATVGRIATGTAPFAVHFDASGDAPTGVFWEFLPAGTSIGSALDAIMNDPGILPIFMDAHTSTTWVSDVALAVGDAPDGAGEGTTLPDSRDLAAPKGLLKRNFKLAGKDQAKVSATLELPGGFAPEGAEVQVCVAGALGTFVLDAKGKGKDLVTGSTVSVKAKWPVGGAGVAAGTVAKLTATLKGDLARALDAAGVRDRTEIRTADYAPLALWLDGVGYNALAVLEVSSKIGKAGKGTLSPLPPD
jgi:hypothetical protein